MAQLPIARREQLPWVILRLGRHHLALSAMHVREMAAMPAITAMPGTSRHLRGMINLRGEVLPLLDLRRMLGLPSLAEEIGELEAVLAQREQEHLAWLAELEAAVAEGRLFTQPRDANECPFGRWYARFSTENPVLAGHLAALDAPHRAVHELAAEVAQLLEAGMAQAARELLSRGRRGTLSRLLRPLRTAREALHRQQREIAVVLDSPRGRSLALAVDEVEAVEEIISAQESLDQDELGPVNHRLLAGVGQRLPGQEVVFLLDLERLLAEGQELAAQAQSG